MSNPDDGPTTKKSATQTLMELVARRKANQSGPAAIAGRADGRQSERAAAARSASKSKPAPRN